MKLLGAALLLCISTMTMAGEKTEVCHIPPGNMAKFKTIMVSEKAVAAHLKHGDKEGACGLLAEYLCNDNDPCTVDKFADGTESCEFNVPGGDVPDGNDCTIDQCTAAVGYEYNPAPGGSVCNVTEGETGTCGFAADAGMCIPDVVDDVCPAWTDEELSSILDEDYSVLPAAQYTYVSDGTKTEIAGFHFYGAVIPTFVRVVDNSAAICFSLPGNYYSCDVYRATPLTESEESICAAEIVAAWNRFSTAD